MKKSELKQLIKECIQDLNEEKSTPLQKLGRKLKVGETYKVIKRHPFYMDFPKNTKLKLVGILSTPGRSEDRVELKWEILSGKYSGEMETSSTGKGAQMKKAAYIEPIKAK